MFRIVRLVACPFVAFATANRVIFGLVCVRMLSQNRAEYNHTYKEER